jgi:hypothetical protein
VALSLSFCHEYWSFGEFESFEALIHFHGSHRFMMNMKVVFGGFHDLWALLNHQAFYLLLLFIIYYYYFGWGKTIYILATKVESFVLSRVGTDLCEKTQSLVSIFSANFCSPVKFLENLFCECNFN